MPAPEIQALLAEIRAATESARAATAEIESERLAMARQREDEERRRETAARRGDLGPDWRVLQQRIDARRTTMAAIMTGEDESPEARRVIGAAMERMARLRGEIDRAAQDGDPADSTSVTAAFRRTQAAADEIRASLERLRPTDGDPRP
jgi:hypothetical protein